MPGTPQIESIGTLFVTGNMTAAAFVTKRKGRRRSRAMQFTDPHAALDWCIARGAGFVYLPGVVPLQSQN